MARSRYIYTVIDTHSAWLVVGVFTVKHEMVTELKRYFSDGLPSRLHIFRCADSNLYEKKVEITSQIKQELLK